MPVGLKVSDIIAISGHRDYPDRASFFRGLDNLRAREYVFGGARGADSDALEYISKTQPRSVRTVIVPNRAIDQPLSARNITNRHATRVIELRNKGAGRFQIRNRAMVDRSTHLRAFYDFRGKGGTLNTINYAKSKGKSFDTWTLRKYDQAQFMKKSPKEFGTWFNRMRGFNVNLSAIKLLIIRFITEVLRITVQAFLKAAGHVGTMTLEAFWYR